MKIDMKITTKILTRSALILALAIAIQAVSKIQFVTGPVINALLILATALISPIGAVLIGLLTPAFALVLGITPLAPAVPVIMLGNAALVITFALLKDKPIIGIIAAALVKYGAMFVGITYIVVPFFLPKLPAKAIAALTTTQLFTALAGGVLALVVLKGLQWIKKDSATLE